MGLSYTPTSFSTGTTISSSAVNANFAAIQATSADFSGTWVAFNNTSTGLIAEDYALTSPLSQNVIHLHPQPTSPDRGIVFSALKGGAASDRLGISVDGKLLTGLIGDASVVTNGIAYIYYNLATGTGNGTFNLPFSASFGFIAFSNSGFMLNCGTTAASGGSAASIGYGNITTSTFDVYVSAGVPWVCIVVEQ